MAVFTYVRTHLPCWLGPVLLLMLATPVGAVVRTLHLEAPATVAAGSVLTVVISASTDAGQGERIGFFQVESSGDGGRSWAAICYLENIETETTQVVKLTAGAAGTTLQLRVRVAFRDGLAGDVDHTGAAIRWTETWAKWREPPAKSIVITLVPQ